MANRFTEQLLAIDPSSHSPISDAGQIINNFDLYSKEVDPLVMGLAYSELTAIRATVICFLAALSDEDLQELKITDQY